MTIHESQIKAAYGNDIQVIRKGDRAWRNPDRVSPYSTERSGERGYMNPLSKMDQKLLQHSDPYRDCFEDVLCAMTMDRATCPEFEVGERLRVSDGRDVVEYVMKSPGEWVRRSISRNAAL